MRITGIKTTPVAVPLNINTTDAQALDEQYLKELADFGIEVVEFTDEELAEIAENMRENVWPKIAADKYSEDFIEELKDSLK